MRWRDGIGAVAAVLAMPGVLNASPEGYFIHSLGLRDADHTRSDGYTNSFINASVGSASIGTSRRYIGEIERGSSAWLFSNGRTARLGLWDLDHTRSDGHQGSFAVLLNGQGTVTGRSVRYHGMDGSGTSAWIHLNGVTNRIGFVDEAHTRSDGYQYSNVRGLSATGQVAGYSQRYSGSFYNGQSAWIYQDGVLLPIELDDSEHTGGGNVRHSEPKVMSTAGHVAGYSHRYVGEMLGGTSTWAYYNKTIVRTGLIDAEHTRADGWRQSEVQRINAAGQSVGDSYRFSGQSAHGWSSWLSEADGSTVRLGLLGAEYFRSDGYHVTQVGRLTESGYVSGRTARQSGGSGLNGWVYKDGVTTRVGLSDAQHTGSGGVQHTSIWGMNESGQAAGQSYRYSGSTWRGYSAWFYDGEQSRLIGLLDATHTRIDGWQSNSIDAINSVGQVAGGALRYSGDQQLGRSSWFYDPETDVTHELVFSVRSDGRAVTSIGHLSDDGMVWGGYTKYSGMTDLGAFAFRWSLADGLQELGELVDGGVAANGWDRLRNTLGPSGSGHVFGQGIIGESDVPYMLTPLGMMLPGDANGDGHVDIADLGILAAHWQQQGFWARGDFNGDGIVDIGDLGFLAEHWQSGISGGPTFSEAMRMFDVFGDVVVPEAGCIWLLGLAGLLARRRR
jgi:hypothetical protein